MIEKIYKNNNLHNFLATLIIYIITFPTLEPSYSIGLDSSYFWALNYLFVNDYAALRQIIYPFGPLGFLKNAVIEGINFELFLIFYSIVKVWFIYMYINIARNIENRKNISYLVITIMLLFFNVDFLLIGIGFIYSFLFLEMRKYYYIVIATFVAFLGLCIKSSIGISLFSIIFVTFILDFLKTRKYKLSLIFAGITLTVILLSGILVFHRIELLFNYIFNTLRLSVSYSSALSLFPSNNWVLLTIVIVCLLLPIFISKESKTRTTFLLLAPSLFAMWKHSITRQDFSHSTIMLGFLLLYWGLFLAFSNISVKKILLLATISISLFYSNMQNTWNFKPKKVEINGIVNFENTILNFNEYKSKFLNKSEGNVQNNKLDEEIIAIIDDKTVDSYPWELSYFSANKELNWKMRPTLQSGSFARWLDNYNAESFTKNNGPEFIIFHYVSDEWGGKFGSIDNRYLLNDNPLAIYEIFNNYSLRLKTDNFLLLKKNNKDNFEFLNKTDISLTTWGDWIDLDDFNDELLTRILISSEQNLLGNVKSFLYKTEQYHIDYLTEEGKIFTFRFIPENAKDGIWINPFIRNPQNSLIEEKVSKIRLRCTHPSFNKKGIQYQVETIKYIRNSKQTDFNSYFLKNKLMGNLPFDYENNFNNTEKSVNQIKSNGGFSFTYSVSLDTIWQNIDKNVNILMLETDLKYLNAISEGVHVVSLSGTENNFWEAKHLDKCVKTWHNSLHIIELERNKHNNGDLKIYVWNTGEKYIYIDDLRVRFKTIKTN